MRLTRRRIDIHLAVTTIKLKTERAPITKAKREWFVPRGATTSMFYTIAQRIAQAMAALHQGAFPTFQLVGRHVVKTIEACRLVIGNVVEVRMGIRLVKLVRLMGHINLLGFMGQRKSLHKLPTQFSELAAGNEIVEVIGQVNIMALVRRVAKLRELADDILALGFFGHLMLHGQTDGSGARSEGKAVGCRMQRHVDSNLAFSTGTREQSLHFLVVVAIETQTRT